jgi:uncharacterized protein YlxP (DUF503 family)
VKKRKSPDQPLCVHGKVTFEFFNNDDEEFKLRALRSLAKEVRKEFNVSCLPVEESMVENPERGTLVIALCAGSHEQAGNTLDRILAFFDGKAPARILLEEFERTEII